MTDPVLHIGFPKTASSWFQESFYPNVQNINYIARESVQQLFLNPGAFDWNAYNCKTQLESLVINSTGRVVLCEELLLGRLRPGGVKHFVTKEVANRLKIIFPRATIIIFIRNQLDAIASAYLQYIQSGGNYSFDKFIFPDKISGGDYNNLVLLGIDYFQYHKVLDYYSDLFGSENVHIYLYEEFCSSNINFITSYSGTYKFAIDIKSLSFKRINEGYRTMLIYPRRFCNAFTRNGPLNKYYIIHLPFADRLTKIAFAKANKCKVFGMRKSTKEILGVKNIEYLKSYYKHSNQILLEKFGLNELARYDYPL